MLDDFHPRSNSKTTAKRPGILTVLYLAFLMLLFIAGFVLLVFQNRVHGTAIEYLEVPELESQTTRSLSLMPLLWLGMRRRSTSYSTWLVPVILKFSFPLLLTMLFSLVLSPLEQMRFYWMIIRSDLLIVMAVLTLRRVFAVQLSPVSSLDDVCEDSFQLVSLRFVLIIMSLCALIFLLDQRMATMESTVVTFESKRMSNVIVDIVNSWNMGMLLVGACCISTCDNETKKRGCWCLLAYVVLSVLLATYHRAIVYPEYELLNADVSSGSQTPAPFTIPSLWSQTTSIIIGIAVTFVCIYVFRSCGYYVTNQAKRPFDSIAAKSETGMNEAGIDADGS